MSRRTTSRAKADANAFAVAVKIVVPRRGLGQLSGEIIHFLNEVVGSDNFASHPGQITGVPQVTTFFFRDLEAAMIFKGRFRELMLANAPRDLELSEKQFDDGGYYREPGHR